MISMRIFLGITACALPLLVAAPAVGSVPDPACDVTTGLDGDPGIPQYLIVGMNELVTKEDLTAEEYEYFEAHEYGEHGLWFGLPEDGVLQGQNLAVSSAGLIGWRKFGIFRDDAAKGDVIMTATHRDHADARFEAHLPDGYGEIGFQVGGAIFSEGGCWDFVVTSGLAQMQFTLWIQPDLDDPLTIPDFTWSTPVESPAGS